MMIPAQTYDSQIPGSNPCGATAYEGRNCESRDVLDTMGDDVAAAFAALEGEIQQVGHWMDDAFGGIEAEAARFVPVLTSMTRPLRGTLAMGAGLLTRLNVSFPRQRFSNR